mmetsp:Transcript_9260/g.28198  ORF Transcript_9260/g.28198 Transcript_9260/m.28198 type:complete len:219 (+) Transcript_9260:886-1542(+)
MRCDGRPVHLLHELRDACACRLAHTVAVGLALCDVVSNNLGRKLRDLCTPVVAHDFTPRLLGEAPHPLSLIVPIEAHGRQKCGQHVVMRICRQALEERARCDACGVADLAPPVTEAIRQLLHKRRRSSDQLVARKRLRHRADGVMRDLPHEAVRVVLGPGDEHKKVALHPLARVGARALQHLAERTAAALETVPALGPVAKLSRARLDHLVARLQQHA